MSDENRPRSGHPRPKTEPAPSRASVPFLERKLDELYDALQEFRRAGALLDAKASLRAGDYSKARQLVEATRQWCTPTEDRRAAPVSLGGKAAQPASADVLSGLAMVLRLLQPLSDWHQQHTQAVEATSPDQAAAFRISRSAADRSDQDEPAPEEPSDDWAEGSNDMARRYSSVNLERGVFSQLLSAAQQCGLVANPDVIIAVRDREVPAGRYQKGFDMIDALYAQFNVQAAQRLATLRREEIEYKAGRLKMSAKQWLTRQRRVTEQNQKIDRARRHFTRVLDALRTIRTSSPE